MADESSTRDKQAQTPDGESPLERPEQSPGAAGGDGQHDAQDGPLDAGEDDDVDKDDDVDRDEEEDEAEDSDEEEDEEDDEEEDEEDEPLDLESRILCSDGDCIGVIGPDGRCKDCGVPVDPADRAAFEAKHRTDDAAPVDERAPAAAVEEPAVEKPAAIDGPPVVRSGGSGLGDRVLCSDGNCIGLIGPDGRCKECGLPYGVEAE